MPVPVTMHKAQKYAVRMDTLPPETKEFFMKNFGCARKVYNLYVDHLYRQLEASGYENGDLPKVSFPNVTEFKKGYPYLKEADSLGLANAKISFEKAVKRYEKEFDHKAYTKRAKRRAASGTEPLSFRGLKGMPKFHAKARGDFTYTTNCQYPHEGNTLKVPTVRLEGTMLYLPKLKRGVELVVHRSLPDGAVIGNATMSMDTDGKMYASVCYTYTVMMDMTIRDAAASGDTSILESLKVLGLDYSQPDFYVDSEGRKANCPHSYRKSEEKLARLQRRLSRMTKGSSNYNRMSAKIRKLHVRIRNQRKDHIEKESCHLARTYDVVVVEDIDLRAMGGCLSLGKNLHDNGFGMFRDALAKKLEAKGSFLIKVDRFFPSSKTCSACGHYEPSVTLGVQEWTCPECGAVLARDPNAAKNIKAEGMRVLFDYIRAWLEKDEKALARAKARSDGRKRGKAA